MRVRERSSVTAEKTGYVGSAVKRREDASLLTGQGTYVDNMAPAGTVSMVVVQWDYRVEGKGRLMPVVKHEVFAMEEGQVMQVKVRGGEKVKKGEVRLDYLAEGPRMQLRSRCV